MGNVSTLTFGGDAQALAKAAARAQQATKGVGDEVKQCSADMGRGAGESRAYESRMTAIGATVAGASMALGDLAGGAQALADFQSRGATKALAHSRALAAVEQAVLDAEQATGDFTQAQEDANQAMVDGKQAAVDVGQAAIDIEQAQLDASAAQEAYTKAVKESGAGSAEARQAQLDLKQAGQDLTQAQLDGEQAQRDQAQAALDGQQATRDMTQATRSAKDAQMDLTEAQREANPSDMRKAATEMESYMGVVSSAVAAVGLAAMAFNAMNVASMRATAAIAASKVATLTGAAATGVATAAQWLLNTAMTANPIGLIIVAIGALVAAVIWIATKTTWFQTAWKVTWDAVKRVFSATVSWVSSAAGAMWDLLRQIPGRLKSTYATVADGISRPFRAAFNYIADAWNGTVGRLWWQVPDWVPGIGGRSVGAPRLPKFHAGGVVPGSPGQEVMAILQAGETVVPAGGRGGQTQLVLTIAPGSDNELTRALLKTLRFADRTGL